MIKYCLPIIAQHKDEVLRRIETAGPRYHAFEVWLDYIEDLDLDFVRSLSARLQERLIVLFRRQGLEIITMPPAKRREIVSALAKSASYLDLDILTQTDDLACARADRGSLNMILSYHNYQETPPLKFLQDVIVRMKNENAAVCKVATLCRDAEDAMRLLALLLELRKTGQRAIVLGMGELGAVTRIFGALWGNELTFAPSSRDLSSAPGQLTQTELESIFSLLGSKDGG